MKAAIPARPVLNSWDRRLLDRNLKFYRSLDEGSRKPETPAQQHFVKVCRGQAHPRTQHEIAYSRYQVRHIPMLNRPALPVVAVTVQPTERVIRIVDAIEEVERQTRSKPINRVLDQIAGLYREGRSQARSLARDGALWATTILSDPDFSRQMTHWATEAWGGLSNVYTQAMDGPDWVKEGLQSGANYIGPWWHRIVEGHSLPASWEAVRDAIPDDSFTDEVLGWLTAFTSDLVTPAGMPIVELTRSQLDNLQNLAERFGIPDLWLQDILTYTGTELVAAAIPGIALALNWKEGKAMEFSRIAGAMGVGAVVSANPLLAILALATVAAAFHRSTQERDQSNWAEGILEGGLMSGVILATSAAVAGPTLVGLIAGVGLAAAISSHGRQASNRVSQTRFNRAEFLDWLSSKTV